MRVQENKKQEGEQTMKKELEYFAIEGAFGGNQDWFSNVVMNMGGLRCGNGVRQLYLFCKIYGNACIVSLRYQQSDKEDYKRFSQVMKPYIRPRVGGVRKLSWYVDGFSKYIAAVQAKLDIEEAGFLNIRMQEVSGDVEYAEAYRQIKSQIDAGLPVPYLMLKHKNTEEFKDFTWHWFLVVGYEEKDEDMLIRIATYGEEIWLSLRKMWATGYEEKGGIVLYTI